MLIESATPCHDTQVMGFYRVSNPLRVTVLAAKSEDYTTVKQHLQYTTSINNLVLEIIQNLFIWNLKAHATWRWCPHGHSCGVHTVLVVWWKYLAEDNKEERDNHSIVSLNEYISL